jgi:hypothetical protein
MFVTEQIDQKKPKKIKKSSKKLEEVEENLSSQQNSRSIIDFGN